MPNADYGSTHGPSWTLASFLAAIGAQGDRSRAVRLFELNKSHPDSYYWFGQTPTGAIFFHPLGFPYAPMNVSVDASGVLVGPGNWNRYPEVKHHDGFSGLASYVGQNHQGPASGFTIAEFDIDEL